MAVLLLIAQSSSGRSVPAEVGQSAVRGGWGRFAVSELSRELLSELNPNG
jgi:hypothetical protein